MSPSASLVPRPAVESDVRAILDRVRDLAEFEGDRERVTARVADYRAALFPGDGEPNVRCHVVEAGGEVCGIAIWYDTFSTWTGRHSTRLVDLFVAPEHRGEGVGAALMRAVGQECLDRGRTRLVWLVATWNAAAIGFYERLGARPEGSDDQYCTYVLDRAGLAALIGR